MSPGEYEQILHDAEVRLSRVKALYEQFFQGIEKLEPTVPRKELDRVLELLRKNQPRNTALRFRTQMLVARYGTYQTYWQRVARQIEEGTYRRDVVRVQQKRRREQAQATKPREEEREAPSGWEIDVDLDLGDPMLSFDESDVDAILGSLGPKKGAAASTPAPAPGRRLSPFASGLPPSSARSIPAPSAGSAAPPATTSFAKPMATFGKPGTGTFGKPMMGTPSPGSPPAAAPPKVASPPAAAPPKVAPPVAAPPKVAPPVAAPPKVAPPAPPPKVAPPAAAPPKVAPPAAAPPKVAPPAPRPPVPAHPAAPPARTPSDPLDEARMRTIYDSYVDARKRNNERVDTVKYESVKQSVQQMMPRLREKHGDRPIDFEVVLQNGKVGLKPKVGG